MKISTNPEGMNSDRNAASTQTRNGREQALESSKKHSSAGRKARKRTAKNLIQEEDIQRGKPTPVVFESDDHEKADHVDSHMQFNDETDVWDEPQPGDFESWKRYREAVRYGWDYEQPDI